jgi:Rubrerythrin
MSPALVRQRIRWFGLGSSKAAISPSKSGHRMDCRLSHEGHLERLTDLSEREILALAIFSEEEDSKIYRGFAEGLREQYPASAKVFDEMADEEVRHRTRLFDLFRSKFGDFLPLIRRQSVGSTPTARTINNLNRLA